MVSSFSINWHFVISAPSLSEAENISKKIVAALPMVIESKVEKYWKFEDSYSLLIKSKLATQPNDNFQKQLEQFKALIGTFGSPWVFRDPITFDDRIEGSAILSTNTGAVANMDAIEWINAEYFCVP